MTTPSDAEDVVPASSSAAAAKTSVRSQLDARVVGLTEGIGVSEDLLAERLNLKASVDELFASAAADGPTVEDMEEEARAKSLKDPCGRFTLGMVAALKIMGFYLITLETVLTCVLTAGLTCYWYYRFAEDQEVTGWDGGGMSFVLLGFAVTTPISKEIGMAFKRREDALYQISIFKSTCYQIYLAHAIWPWDKEGGKHKHLVHCDAVLAQLVGTIF